jgi:hypothetical protein
VRTWFLETKSAIKTQRRYRTRYGSGPSANNAIRRWVKQLQATASALHRNRAVRPSTSQEDVDKSRKRFLGAHRNQLDELLCSWVHHTRLFGGLFIAALTSVPAGHGNPDNNLECSIATQYGVTLDRVFD